MKRTQFLKLWFCGLSIMACCTLFSPSPVVAGEVEDKVAKSLAHYTMGLMYDWQGESESAIIEFGQALAFDDSRFGTHLRIGADFARVGKFKEAIDHLQQAAKLDAKDL